VTAERCDFLKRHSEISASVAHQRAKRKRESEGPVASLSIAPSNPRHNSEDDGSRSHAPVSTIEQGLDARTRPQQLREQPQLRTGEVVS
jgi:hypothetical protein